MTSPLLVALDELLRGVAEIPDPHGENPRIVEYHATTGQPGDDEIPWCSSFVNWCVQQAGGKGTGSARARSWLGWGRPDAPRPGTICVLWRGSPTSATGHVGFLLDHDEYGVYLLGGNQGNRVSVRRYPKSQVLSYRKPEPVEGDNAPIPT